MCGTWHSGNSRGPSAPGTKPQEEVIPRRHGDFRAPVPSLSLLLLLSSSSALPPSPAHAPFSPFPLSLSPLLLPVAVASSPWVGSLTQLSAWSRQLLSLGKDSFSPSSTLRKPWQKAPIGRMPRPAPITPEPWPRPPPPPPRGWGCGSCGCQPPPDPRDCGRG